MLGAILTILIALILGGTTALIAGQALPNEPMWAVKVHVNEPLSGFANSSATARANWELGLIDTRIAEAEALAKEGKLDNTLPPEFMANLAMHIDDVSQAAVQISQKNSGESAADIIERLQATLEAATQNLSNTDTAHIVVPTLQHDLDNIAELSAQVNARL